MEKINKKLLSNFGVGIDVTKISYFKNKSEHFIKRILTKNEFLEYLNIDDLNKPKFLASRWALKEATYKALNLKDIFFINLEFLKQKNGSIICTSFNDVKVSISYCEDKVYAIAIFCK